MPILYNNISGGRILCALFFICISLAGFSSLVSFMERIVRLVIDYGSKYVCAVEPDYYINLLNVVRRVPATIIVGSTAFLVGLGSALDLDFLINQVLALKIYVRVCTYIHTYLCLYPCTYVHTVYVHENIVFSYYVSYEHMYLHVNVYSFNFCEHIST